MQASAAEQRAYREYLQKHLGTQSFPKSSLSGWKTKVQNAADVSKQFDDANFLDMSVDFLTDMKLLDNGVDLDAMKIPFNTTNIRGQAVQTLVPYSHEVAGRRTMVAQMMTQDRIAEKIPPVKVVGGIRGPNIWLTEKERDTNFKAVVFVEDKSAAWTKPTPTGRTIAGVYYAYTSGKAAEQLASGGVSVVVDSNPDKYSQKLTILQDLIERGVFGGTILDRFIENADRYAKQTGDCSIYNTCMYAFTGRKDVQAFNYESVAANAHYKAERDADFAHLAALGQAGLSTSPRAIAPVQTPVQSPVQTAVTQPAPPAQTNMPTIVNLLSPAAASLPGMAATYTISIPIQGAPNSAQASTNVPPASPAPAAQPTPIPATAPPTAQPTNPATRFSHTQLFGNPSAGVGGGAKDASFFQIDDARRRGRLRTGRRR
jgi:hypothetical protein